MAPATSDEAGLKTRSRAKALRFRLEAALVRGVGAVVSLLPMAAVRRCGHAFGRLMYWVDGFHRRIALANLASAFPSRSVAECRALAKAMFAHFGGLVFELLKFRALSREQMAALMEVEGVERIVHAHAQGRGVFFMTGHFGYWEM